PNMFRRFFAEGAFNMAFVPMFSKKVEGGDDALGFARDAFTGLATILIAFTLVAQVAMPFLVLAMASGFAADERFDLAVVYGRIAFPYILFISLAALLSGVLNSKGRFVAAAAAPVVLNVLFVAAMVLAGTLGWPIGDTLAWTVPVAGIAQLALVWTAAARAGFRLTLRRPRLTPELKRLAIIAGPAALAGGVVQVNLLIGRQVASFFDGAVAWLSYADRLYQLPLGVVGIAIGVVLLPDLSRRLRAEDTNGGRDAFNRAGEFALALTLPAAVALAVIPGPIVGVLFQRGAFDAADAAATALAVAVYGAGLPAFVMQKVLQPLFFAREDTRRPFYYALAALAVNAGLAIGLAPVIGYIAAAWGTTLAGWAMVLLLWRGSRRYGTAAELDDRFTRRLGRIVLASGLMGAILWGAAWALAPWLSEGGLRYAALAALIALGIVAYFGLGHLLGAFRLSEFRRAMRRQR
ncbi:MAG: murein biosynthesis integral membrane protein MurJ, partial [Rhodovulum sp.]